MGARLAARKTWWLGQPCVWSQLADATTCNDRRKTLVSSAGSTAPEVPHAHRCILSEAAHARRGRPHAELRAHAAGGRAAEGRRRADGRRPVPAGPGRAVPARRTEGLLLLRMPHGGWRES